MHSPARHRGSRLQLDAGARWRANCLRAADAQRSGGGWSNDEDRARAFRDDGVCDGAHGRGEDTGMAVRSNTNKVRAETIRRFTDCLRALAAFDNSRFGGDSASSRITWNELLEFRDVRCARRAG